MYSGILTWYTTAGLFVLPIVTQFEAVKNSQIGRFWIIIYHSSGMDTAVCFIVARKNGNLSSVCRPTIAMVEVGGL